MKSPLVYPEGVLYFLPSLHIDAPAHTFRIYTPGTLTPPSLLRTSKPLPDAMKLLKTVLLVIVMLVFSCCLCSTFIFNEERIQSWLGDPHNLHTIIPSSDNHGIAISTSPTLSLSNDTTSHIFASPIDLNAPKPYTLSQTPTYTHPSKFKTLQTFQTPDALLVAFVAHHTTNNDLLGLCAIDHTTGNLLWETSIELPTTIIEQQLDLHTIQSTLLITPRNQPTYAFDLSKHAHIWTNTQLPHSLFTTLQTSPPTLPSWYTPHPQKRGTFLHLKTAQEVTPNLPQLHHALYPCVIDDTLYTFDNTQLHTIDLPTNTHTPLGPPISFSSKPSPDLSKLSTCAFTDNTLIFSTHLFHDPYAHPNNETPSPTQRAFFAVHRTTGKLLWESPLSNIPETNQQPYILHLSETPTHIEASTLSGPQPNPLVFFTTHNPKQHDIAHIHSINTQDGTLHTAPLPNSRSNPHTIQRNTTHIALFQNSTLSVFNLSFTEHSHFPPTHPLTHLYTLQATSPHTPTHHNTHLTDTQLWFSTTQPQTYYNDNSLPKDTPIPLLVVKSADGQTTHNSLPENTGATITPTHLTHNP